MNHTELYWHVYRIQQEAILDGDDDQALKRLRAVALLATGLLERLHNETVPYKEN